MSEASELLPCPFCGSPPLTYEIGDEDDEYTVVECGACGQAWAHEDNFSSSAAEAWNTRSLPEAQLRAAVERALEMAATSSVMSDFNYDDERRAWSYAQHKIRAISVEDVLEGLK